VAPIKSVSIPRLKLNAALLLTRLLTIVKESLTIPVNNTICSTDSEIVLHWLSAPPRNWNTYVCNRTAEILSEYPRSCWSHVRSEDNPADCAFRGLHPSKLLDHELWWKGPSWMALPQFEWPLSTSTQYSSAKVHPWNRPSRSLVLLKLIFQESWTAVLHCDEPIPEALNARWRALLVDLSSLTKCQVPRYIAAPYQHIQLHGFTDASMHVRCCCL